MEVYFCTLDVGTTGVKAAIISANGKINGLSYREYQVHYPKPGWVEQSVEAVWKAICTVVQEAIAVSQVPVRQITALAISNQRATFVPVDKNDQPLTPYILWQDQRGVKQCDWIKERISAADYYAISGLDIGTTQAVSKILWLKLNHPDIFRRTAKFATMQDMLLRQFGVANPPSDLASASWTGLMDVDRFSFSDDLLNLLEIPPDKMPDVVASCQVVGVITEEVAQACGLLAGTTIISGGGDGQCASLGCGATSPGQVSLVLGTAAAIFSPIDQPKRDSRQALNCSGHVIPGFWVMEGSALASGSVYRWWRDTFCALETIQAKELNLDVYELLDRELATLDGRPTGILALPTFMGGGTPDWNPYARGGLIGLTLAHSRKDILLAIAEGIFLEIRGLSQSVKALGIPIENIRAVGGMTNSKILSQLLANVLGTTLQVPQISHSGLVGAAICASVGSGVFSSVQAACDQMVKIENSFPADPIASSVYQDLFRVYQKTYNLLCDQGIFEELQAIAAGK
jgi:xylulokinase